MPSPRPRKAALPAELDPDRVREVLRNTRARGELDVILLLIRYQAQADDLKLRRALRQRVLTNPVQWGNFQYAQGRLSAFEDVVGQLVEYAKAPAEPKNRPDPA